MSKAIRVLNLGAGVQSTAIFAMITDGELPAVDYAVFADVGDEPASVYSHLEFLKTIGGPEIVTVTIGNLGDNLVKGVNSTGQRHIAIPTYLAIDGIPATFGRRQCTREYKIKPIEKEIRRRAGVQPGHRVPKSTQITQVFGLSYDEPRRVVRARDQFRSRTQWNAEFPLFDAFMTRADCVTYLQSRFPEITVPRSACVFCPFKSDSEWKLLKETDPTGWSRAVEIDAAIREETSACTRGVVATQYLHKSCKPLDQIEFTTLSPDRQKRIPWSDMDCEGMCGV